jgi:hypothetical protein
VEQVIDFVEWVLIQMTRTDHDYWMKTHDHINYWKTSQLPYYSTSIAGAHCRAQLEERLCSALQLLAALTIVCDPPQLIKLLSITNMVNHDIAKCLILHARADLTFDEKMVYVKKLGQIKGSGQFGLYYQQITSAFVPHVFSLIPIIIPKPPNRDDLSPGGRDLMHQWNTLITWAIEHYSINNGFRNRVGRFLGRFLSGGLDVLDLHSILAQWITCYGVDAILRLQELYMIQITDDGVSVPTDIPYIEPTTQTPFYAKLFANVGMNASSERLDELCLEKHYSCGMTEQLLEALIKDKVIAVPSISRSSSSLEPSAYEASYRECHNLAVKMFWKVVLPERRRVLDDEPIMVITPSSRKFGLFRCYMKHQIASAPSHLSCEFWNALMSSGEQHHHHHHSSSAWTDQIISWLENHVTVSLHKSKRTYRYHFNEIVKCASEQLLDLLECCYQFAPLSLSDSHGFIQRLYSRARLNSIRTIGVLFQKMNDTDGREGHKYTILELSRQCRHEEDGWLSLVMKAVIIQFLANKEDQQSILKMKSVKAGVEKALKLKEENDQLVMKKVNSPEVKAERKAKSKSLHESKAESVKVNDAKSIAKLSHVDNVSDNDDDDDSVILTKKMRFLVKKDDFPIGNNFFIKNTGMMRFLVKKDISPIGNNFYIKNTGMMMTMHEQGDIRLLLNDPISYHNMMVAYMNYELDVKNLNKLIMCKIDMTKTEIAKKTKNSSSSSSIGNDSDDSILHCALDEYIQFRVTSRTLNKVRDSLLRYVSSVISWVCYLSMNAYHSTNAYVVVVSLCSLFK